MNNDNGPQNYPTRSSLKIVQPYKREYSTLMIANDNEVLATRCIYNVSKTIRIYDNRLVPYLGDLLIGGTVIDKRSATNHPEFSKWMVNGPSLNETLMTFTVEKNGVKSSCYDPKQAGVYDSISLDLYIDLWKALGARIGKRIGDSIVWDGEDVITSIPLPEHRWQG